MMPSETIEPAGCPLHVYVRKSLMHAHPGEGAQRSHKAVFRQETTAVFKVLQTPHLLNKFVALSAHVRRRRHTEQMPRMLARTEQANSRKTVQPFVLVSCYSKYLQLPSVLYC